MKKSKLGEEQIVRILKEVEAGAKVGETVASLPYLIVYQDARNTVTIIAVFHGARYLVRALAESKKKTAG